MKVLQVIDRMMRGGGAEKFVLDLTLALNKIKDVQVDVLSISSPMNSDYIDELKQNGISHNTLSESLYTLRNISRLNSVIKNGKYDVIHVHLFPALYIAALTKKIFNLSTRLIYTEHSTHNRRRNNRLFRILDRRIYKTYDTVIGISDKVKANLDYHLGSNDVKIINNGVNLKAIAQAPDLNLREVLGLPDDTVIVTMVSRITEGKDFETVIKAIETLPQKFNAVFVGDGPLMTELRRQRESSPAKYRIHLLGLRNDVFSINKNSDIIVLSTHHEGFSIAMLEAMACRKPFVASSVEGIKDLVSNIAELFEYKNPQELSSILFNLYNNKEYYDRVSENCYRFAKKFDIDNVASKYLNVY